MTALQIIIISAIVVATATFAILRDYFLVKRPLTVKIEALSMVELEDLWHEYMLDGWKIKREVRHKWSWYHLGFVYSALLYKPE